MCQLFREALLSEGFLEIHTPKLLSGASEGGAAVFKFDYMGRPGCLAQSPQFYKQVCGAMHTEAGGLSANQGACWRHSAGLCKSKQGLPTIRPTIPAPHPRWPSALTLAASLRLARSSVLRTATHIVTCVR